MRILASPRRGTWNALSALRIAGWLLAALSLYALYTRAPMHHRDGSVRFLRIGPAEDIVNLPIGSLRCEPHQNGTRCERSFDGQTLRIVYEGSFASALRCRAVYGGREIGCSPTTVNRGYPEPALRIEDGLGTTGTRRALLRTLDPLSHMSEGDWGVPMWTVMLLLGTTCARTTYRFLGGVGSITRWSLSLVAAGIGGLLGLSAASLLMFSLGYFD